MSNIAKRVEVYVEAIIANYADYQDRMRNGKSTEHDERMKTQFAESMKSRKGKKYIKITREGGGVHAFIVAVENDPKFKYGDILKPAGYHNPTRNFSRGNVFTGGYSAKWSGI